jgi:hypothetical protein
MNQNLKIGFFAGAIGAVILAAIMYLMMTGTGQVPAFVGMFRAWFGANPPLDHVLGALGFVLAGGIWGLLFTALVHQPTLSKGMLFGLLPTLFLWLVLAPATGKPLFNGFTPQGIILPLVFNVIVWGSFVGWYCSRRIHPTVSTRPGEYSSAQGLRAG